MFALFKSLVVCALVAVAQADTIKITAQNDNTFNPNSVTAKKGDVLEFHFQPKNHSVVAGDYKYPCSPLPIGSGFFSGYIDVESGEAGKVFRVTMNNTDPMAFYSSQGDECPKGMVGMVNPSGTETLDDYKKRAGGLARGVTPGNSPYGGDVTGNASPSPSGSKNGDKDKGDKSGAGALRASLLALATTAWGAIILSA
ncbi:extracellular serine-rich protein [Metarhizium guizhouense ARSEF 977]|uniref:Extracellular serine-rich protein n=1 Tax=Metarhizium guizhouense (strain ARSEF 977) TaxID=1276136 RepID=A0A0B4HJ86_METGA|nr:extracellular serine-rich protein [Metarhizium guizhouense ARSEF 977]